MNRSCRRDREVAQRWDQSLLVRSDRVILDAIRDCLAILDTVREMAGAVQTRFQPL